MRDSDRIEQRIAQLRTELADLETAKRVLANLSGDTSATAKPVVTPSSHVKITGIQPKNILEYAKQILADSGEGGMHSIRVADEAIHLGFKGRGESDPAKIRKSFAAIMNRNPEVFEALGASKFRLIAK